MNIVSSLNAWRELRGQINSKKIGFVPTMGNLHQGHLSLCKRSQAENDLTVVSIFVNPTQFNQSQDFEHYPRTLEQDFALLEEVGVDYVLVPSPAEMYPDGFELKVTEEKIAQILEGQHRPGHFTGMLTVVLKWLNLVQAQNAYFGEKDYQQLLLVKKMASALFLPCKIIACPTVREESGLAMSSRNSRLTEAQKKLAAKLYQVLCSSMPLDQMHQVLSQEGFKVEYLAEEWGRRLVAACLGEVRLIDNIGVETC